MSGSRFVYVLFLILLGFGGGGYAIHNWSKVKNYVPTEVSKAAENIGHEAVSVYDKIITGGKALFYGTATTSESKRQYTSPVGPVPGSHKIAASQSSGRPRFESMLLTRKKGSMFSGRAAPGSHVTVEANGRSLGRTNVNKSGAWQLYVEEPLRENNYKFGILSRGAGPLAKVKRGEDSYVKFTPGDGDDKVISFSNSGIGAVALVQPKPQIPILPDAPEIPQKKLSRTPAENILVAPEDGPTIPGDLVKRAGKLADDASRKFTEILEGQKPTAPTEKKIALAPGVAPIVSDIKPEEPKSLTEIQAPDTGLNVDNALKKAGDLAAEAKEGIVGYLEKLGLSDKSDKSDKSGQDQKADPEEIKTPAKKSIAALTFDKVLMDQAGGQSGRLSLKGQAEPGANISIFLGQRAIASVVADSAGNWSFEGMRNIPYGRNLLRAMQSGDGGEVLSRAQYSLRRIAPKTVVTVEAPVSPAQPNTARPASRTPDRMANAEVKDQPAAPVATRKPIRKKARNYRSRAAKSYARSKARSKARAKKRYRSAQKRKKRIRLASARKHRKQYRKKYRKTYRKKYRRAMKLGAASRIPKKLRKYRKRKSYRRKLRRCKHCKRGFVSYRVRRGDSLWKIAKRRYGKGRRYRRIYRNNRGRIAKPNRIYRNQRLCLRRR